MKILFLLFLLFYVANCTSNKKTFWCGDHPCINKAERKAYFKKTMIVEVRDLKNNNNEDNLDLEMLMEKGGKFVKNKVKTEKNLNKQAKKENKMIIKEQKRLAKIAKNNEKEIIKKEKLLAKQIQKDIKKSSKKNLIAAKKIDQKPISEEEEKYLEPKEVKSGYVNKINNSYNFRDLVNKIMERNSLKSYPDINKTPD